jgi:uncharacterized protein (TIGR02145 family)
MVDKSIMIKRFVLISTLVLLITFGNSYSQTPMAFKYQAVARDHTGHVISNQEVSIRINILKESLNGQAVYMEKHDTTTNKYGLVTLIIGRGDVLKGDLSNIDWEIDSYFLKIEMDETGGTDYKDMGTTQLLAMPYALYAGNVENANDADADPGNELISNLSLNNDTLYIGDINNYSIDLNAIKGTDSQNLVISGDTFRIEGGQGSIDLSQYIEDEDSDPGNELQALMIVGDSIKISKGNTVKLITSTDLDADTTNEIQDLQLNGDILTITLKDPSTQVNLAQYIDNTDNQILSISGDTLYLSHVDPVKLPAEKDPTFTASAAYGIQQEDTAAWNAKSEFNGDYNSLANKPDLSSYMTKELDSISEFITDAGNKSITNLSDPVDEHDASTKTYVDSILEIMHILQNGVTDIDGYHYDVVLIGNQIWMAENLRVTKYPDGTPILDIHPIVGYAGGYRWYEDDLDGDGDTDSQDSLYYVNNYGYLYRWTAIMYGYSSSNENPSGVQGVCPDGWHLPSHTEWTELTDYVGTEPGTKLKEGGYSGFNVKMGGFHFGVSASWYFNYFGTHGWYWTCTMWASEEPYHRIFRYADSGVSDMLNTAHAYKWNHMSIRCVRDWP